MSHYVELKKILDNPNWDASIKEAMVDVYIKLTLMARAIKMVGDFEETEPNYYEYLEGRFRGERKRAEVIDK